MVNYQVQSVRVIISLLNYIRVSFFRHNLSDIFLKTIFQALRKNLKSMKYGYISKTHYNSERRENYDLILFFFTLLEFDTSLL